MRGQLRDAAQTGRQEETEVDRAQGAVRSAAQESIHRLEKLVRDRRKGKVKTYEGRWESSGPYDTTRSEHPTSATQAEPTVSPSGGEAMRIKARNSAYSSSSMDINRVDPGKSGPPQIKTKDACIQYHSTVPEYNPAIKNAVPLKHQTPRSPQRGRQSSIRERPQKIPVRETQNNSVPGHMNPAAEQNHQSSQPLEQGRQRFVRQRQEKTAAQRRANFLGSENAAPAQQQDIGNIQPWHIPTPSVQEGKRSTGNAVRKTVSSGKRQVKAARSGVKATGRTSRQVVKTAEHTARTTVKTAEHGAKTAQKTAQATVKASRQAVQAARATARTAATTAKSVARATVSAIKAAIAAAQEVAAAIAAGGGAVIAVVLVLCLAGALLLSPLGIFFSGENSGTGQTISSAVAAAEGR